MGVGITVQCKTCDYHADFRLGFGMMYSSLENVIFLVSPARREKVKNLLQRPDVQSVKYEHKLFVCPECHHLASHFDFSIQYNQDQIYRPYFKCPDCHTRLVELEEPVSDIPCPKCSNKTLAENMSMLWD